MTTKIELLWDASRFFEPPVAFLVVRCATPI
jgi:hypothetical protein